MRQVSPDKKKVLHIATRFLRGGSERDLSNAIHSLPEHEYESWLVVGEHHSKDVIEELVPSHCRVIVEPHLRRPVNPYHDFRALMKLTSLARTECFDAILTCQSKAGVLGRMAGKLSGTPLILHNLSMANFFEGKSPVAPTLYAAAERLVGTWTNAYFVVGEDLRQRYVRAGIAHPERFHVVRSSIDLERFMDAACLSRREARSRLGLPEDEHVVSYVGSLQSRKGVMQLPAYLKALKAKSQGPVRMLIAGEGELDAQLEAAFADEGLQNSVTMLGHTDEVPTVMAASDCLVLLSEAEGLPQVLVQAVAVRRPFVAYPVDGTQELIQLGATGTVVPDCAPSSAAEATLSYLNDAALPALDLSEWDAGHVQTTYHRHLTSRIEKRPVKKSLDLLGDQS